MAKGLKKKLRRLNQRAGAGVMQLVYPMTMIVLKPKGGLPEGSGEEPRSREGLVRYKGNPVLDQRRHLSILGPLDANPPFVLRMLVCGLFDALNRHQTAPTFGCNSLPLSHCGVLARLAR